MCLPHTQTGRHTLRSPPCDHPSRGAWHSTVCCLGDSLGLCPRALPREEYSRDDKAAQSLRDGPVPAPPAIDSRAEEPSREVTCLKSLNAGATAAQLQACRLSAVSPPSGVRPPPWDLMDQGAAWASQTAPCLPGWQTCPPHAGALGLPAFSHKQGISGSILGAPSWVCTEPPPLPWPAGALGHRSVGVQSRGLGAGVWSAHYPGPGSVPQERTS